MVFPDLGFALEEEKLCGKSVVRISDQREYILLYPTFLLYPTISYYILGGLYIKGAM